MLKPKSVGECLGECLGEWKSVVMPTGHVINRHPCVLASAGEAQVMNLKRYSSCIGTVINRHVVTVVSF